MNRRMQVAALLGATVLSTNVWAQNIDEVIVYSAPFQKSVTDVISTTEVKTAEQLQASIDKPIGDVLADLPGVDSAGFGPAVGQPLIRGLGGYRVDTMVNGMTLGDIAATAGDHANAMSLFDTDRVEVLKGPAALRYGAFAATGVVNSFNRHMDAEADDTTDVLLGTGNNADETLMGFFARRGDFAISAYSQEAGNITIPTGGESAAQVARECEHEQEEDPNHVCETHSDDEVTAANTETESSGFTVSGRFGDDATNLSLMLVNHEMEYGVPGHSHGGGAAVVIDAEQQTAQARLMHNLSGNRFDTLQADLTIGAFEQTEGETTFDQDSMHLRTELRGERNGWQTLVGLEFRDNDLTATTVEEDAGEDDDDDHHGFYLPNTERSQYGLFVFAERERNDWLSELALRFDNVEQDSFHTEDPAENASVSNDLTNYSIGLARKLDGDMLVGGSLSSTERAPSQVELFAEGEHAAVSRNELGDPTLDKESSLAMELYLRRQFEGGSLRFALFNNDYSDFIYMARNATRDEAAEDILGFDYKQQDAELSGYEVEYLTGFDMGGRTLDVKLSYSAISGELADGGNLPAMPPEKIGLGLGMDFNTFRLNVDIENAADQEDTSAHDVSDDEDDELATDGYTSIDISAGWSPARYEGLHITAAVRNVTDEEIRHHTSALKDLLPEPGQDIRLTARYKF